MTSHQQEIQALLSAITAQENLRPILGDAVVDATISVLKEKLTALQAQAQAASEKRKLVTILFCDIKGSTALAERFDPEEWADIMNQVFPYLIDPVYRNQGIVARLMGDAILAFFGADVVREDDAIRGVQAGLEIIRGIEEFRQKILREYGIEFNIRVGLNSGLVLLGQIGSAQKGEFTAMGDTINLAARMEQNAPTDGILITAETAQLLGGHFELEAQPPLIIKGKDEPISTFRVLRRLTPSTLLSNQPTAAPMIGRQKELRTLQDAWLQATQNAQTSIMLMIGEAGVGKTRLLQEFYHWLQGQQPPPTIYSARCTPEHSLTAFGLLRQIFQTTWNIQSNDDLPTVRQKFIAGMRKHLPLDRAQMVGQFLGFDFSHVPAVQNLQNSPTFADLAQSYLLQAFRSITRTPTTLLIEDLHWTDRSSIEFLLALKTELPNQPLFLLGMARPTIQEIMPDLPCTLHSLAPLPNEDGHSLIQQTLGQSQQLPKELENIILYKSKGNPYYINELIKMLIQQGTLIHDQGKWKTRAEWHQTLRIPTTLQALLQARLDALPAEELQILQIASVMGERFWQTALAILQETDAPLEQDLSTLLTNLQHRQVILPSVPSSLPGHNEFLFEHDLLRSVTYETVLLKRRNKLHLHLAEWLAQTLGERQSEFGSLIAQHYEKGGDNLKAAYYLLQTAKQAYQRNAYKTARSLLEHTLELLPETEIHQRAEAGFYLGKCYDILGQYEATQAIMNTSTALALQSQDFLLASKCLQIDSWIDQQQGRLEESKRKLRLALQYAQEAQDEIQTVICQILLIGQENSHDYDKIIANYLNAIQIFAKHNDLSHLATTHLNLGNLYIGQKQFLQAVEHYQIALETYQSIGNSWGVENCLNNLSIAFSYQGQYVEAQNYAQQALLIAEDIGDREGIALTLISQVHALHHLGQPTSARPLLRRALSIIQQMDLVILSLEAILCTATQMRFAGNAETAAELIGYVQSNNTEKNPEIELLLEAESQHVATLLTPESFQAAKQRCSTQSRSDIFSLIESLLS